MKQDTIILYVLATIFGGCWPAGAFVTNSQSAAESTSKHHHQLRQQQQQQQLNNVAADLMRFPADSADGTPYITAGSVSFRPHDSAEVNERSVYDPGDELLRALNAELAASGNDLGTLPQEPDYADTVLNELDVVNKFDMLRQMEDELKEEQDIVSKSAILMKFLEDPSLETLPVVYVEEEPLDERGNVLYPSTTGMEKRSRYSRRYPWKRHNRNYEPELRYACTPSKEDVFKLLVGLHENRKGNHHKTVNFCNRKRPAKAIFTNIRFLG